jgi:adenylate cyclase
MALMERVLLKRRLIAVLVADVVGYSRLMSVDEEGTHTRLGNCVKYVIEPTVRAHQGRLTRSKGDSLLAEFDSAVDAVRCALEIQHSLGDATADDNHKLELRIGINSGDVIVDEHEVYGNSVNIAARIEGLAEPGCIYVTETVREQLLAHTELCLQYLGERRVKNIDRPIRVYCVIGELEEDVRTPSRAGVLARLFAGRALHFGRRATMMSLGVVAVTVTVGTAGLPVWREHAQLSPRASIMVLPFRNSSGDPGEDYIADAVTDDLTTDLSRLSDTLVIARATAFTYKGKAVDARDIRSEFGVRYMLEGSVGKLGTRLQANAELVDTNSAANIWADRFDTEVTSLPELYDAVTGRIAASLNLQLVRAENRRAIAERPRDPDAVDLRLRAMAQLGEKLTPQNSLLARKSLQASVARDPHSAETWSQLAWVLALDYVNGWNEATRERELVQAREALRQAFANDPGIATAYYADGLIRRTDGDQKGALESFEQARRLNPNYALAYAHNANQLIIVGRPNEAPALVKQAIAISPRDPSLGFFYHIMGRAYFHTGDYQNAIGWLEKSVRIRDNVWYNRAYLISAYALTGRPEVNAALSEYHEKFKDWPLERVRNWYINEIQHTPANIGGAQELVRGLQLAGL